MLLGAIWIHAAVGNFGISTPLWDFILRTTLPR
jgi:hypothetical protein